MGWQTSVYKGMVIEFWGPIEDNLDKYYHFARFLLNGQVLQFFKAIQKGLVLKAEQIKLSNLDPNLSRLVNSLRAKEALSKL